MISRLANAAPEKRCSFTRAAIREIGDPLYFAQPCCMVGWVICWREYVNVECHWTIGLKPQSRAGNLHRAESMLDVVLSNHETWQIVMVLSYE